MEKIFKELCTGLFKELKKDELLTLSFCGENSQFIRLITRVLGKQDWWMMQP
ncbi:MAG: hypothetical protein CM1200mP10_25810 [Candidatus Neomarinimicrobiota bacterium]|nr:MAG: hypothetical protein CM1200mP10_25810 [Candidatus Neomarinimicrobiota bacterium]